MKSILITPILIVIVFYILFGEFDITITKNKIQHQYKLNGLILVLIDFIRKHDTDEERKRFYKHTKTNLPI